LDREKNPVYVTGDGTFGPYFPWRGRRLWRLGPRALRKRTGSGTGWSREQRYVDAQLDAQDAKDRQQLIMEKANEQAMLKVRRNQSSGQT
jgi:hypothetical protein